MIEYTPAGPAQLSPIFLFVVDTCLGEDDLKILRDALVVTLCPRRSYRIWNYGQSSDILD